MLQQIQSPSLALSLFHQVKNATLLLFNEPMEVSQSMEVTFIGLDTLRMIVQQDFEKDGMEQLGLSLETL